MAELSSRQHPGAGECPWPGPVLLVPGARVSDQEGGGQGPVPGQAGQLGPQQLRDQWRLGGLQGALGGGDPQPPTHGLQLPYEERHGVPGPGAGLPSRPGPGSGSPLPLQLRPPPHPPPSDEHLQDPQVWPHGGQAAGDAEVQHGEERGPGPWHAQRLSPSAGAALCPQHRAEAVRQVRAGPEPGHRLRAPLQAQVLGQAHREGPGQLQEDARLVLRRQRDHAPQVPDPQEGGARAADV